MTQFDPSAVIAAEQRGMVTAYWAQVRPDAIAAHDQFGASTFAEVNANANRIVRLLRDAGVKAGDHIAFVCSNRTRVMEIMAASFRGGYRLVPVNWRLTSEEIAYILDDCDARAVFVEAGHAEALVGARDAPGLKARFVLDVPADGFVLLDSALGTVDGADIGDPVLGSTMLYTSGTTGRPKGVWREKLNLIAPMALAQYDRPGDVQLCVCPMYHGSGLTVETRPAMTAGVPVVFLRRWDSHEVLRLIAHHRITHAHMVPIMFQRLLALPDAERLAHDVSSLRYLVHGASPCPAGVKRAMIDWLGPILSEYYAGTEGNVGFTLGSGEWLRKPGSVGKRPAGLGVKILDDDGGECAPGVDGHVYFQRPAENGFVYYKDPEKTAASHVGGYYTLGDIGHFDADDYLHLTGRSADCIISGGVNIYPQEIDNQIIRHPAVSDVATVGAPNDEWGEEVKAVVALRPGVEPSDDLASEIIALTRAHLAAYKIPRSIDFVDELPRNATGKIERGKVRARYWAGRASQI